VRWNWARLEERSAHSLPHVFTGRQWKCAVSRPQRLRPQRCITHCASRGIRGRSGRRSCLDGALDQSALAMRPLSGRSRWNLSTIRALFLWFGCRSRDRLRTRLIAPYQVICGDQDDNDDGADDHVSAATHHDLLTRTRRSPQNNHVVGFNVTRSVGEGRPAVATGDGLAADFVRG